MNYRGMNFAFVSWEVNISDNNLQRISQCIFKLAALSGFIGFTSLHQIEFSSFNSFIGNLGRIRQSIAGMSREVILSLSTGERCLECWAPQYKRDMDILEQVQEMAGKMIKDLERLSYK